MDKELKWEWVIKSDKQENGIWGTPQNMWKIDRIIRTLTPENWLKKSALIIGISEAYPNETFEVFNSTDTGFFVQLSNSGKKNIRFNDYELNGNILTWIGGKPL